MINRWQQHSDILHCDKGRKLICCFSNQTTCNGLQFINDQVGLKLNRKKLLSQICLTLVWISNILIRRSLNLFYVLLFSNQDAEEIHLLSEPHTIVSWQLGKAWSWHLPSNSWIRCRAMPRGLQNVT